MAYALHDDADIVETLTMVAPLLQSQKLWNQQTASFETAQNRKGVILKGRGKSCSKCLFAWWGLGLTAGASLCFINIGNPVNDPAFKQPTHSFPTRHGRDSLRWQLAPNYSQLWTNGCLGTVTGRSRSIPTCKPDLDYQFSFTHKTNCVFY